jgi:hypothetical protein
VPRRTRRAMLPRRLLRGEHGQRRPLETHYPSLRATPGFLLAVFCWP